MLQHNYMKNLRINILIYLKYNYKQKNEKKKKSCHLKYNLEHGNFILKANNGKPESIKCT